MNKTLRFMLVSLLTMLCGTMVAADSWVKTDPTSLKTGDVVVIADLTSTTAMSNDKGTSNPPSATEIELNSDKTEITSDVADNLQWIVTVQDGTYKFGVAGTENFLYTTNTNNGVRVGTNANNGFTLEKGGDSNVDFLKNTATSRYLGVYDNSQWRCYTSIHANIKETETAFFKKQSGEAPVPAVAQPVFSPTGGTFLGSQEVTLSCETEGAKVYYTLDGNDPTTESTAYTEPFTVTETTTVKAIAAKDNALSSVATATFTAIPSFATLASMAELANDALFGFTGEALVVAKPTAKYVYVKDATGSSLIYDTTGEKTTAAEVGKTIAANWTGKVSIYKNLFELVPDNAIMMKEGDAAEVTYPEVTAADITAEHINEVVTLKGITGYTVDGKNLTITIGENNVVGYNQFVLEIAAAEEGKTYEMVGAISRYNDGIQFQPIEIKEEAGIELPEIVNADFNPEADPIGWTEVVSEQYKDLGMYQIGGEAMVRFAAPTADETHLSSEFAAGFECRWQTNFASYTQNVTMPAGAYALCFDVENVNGSTTKASYENRFFVKIGEETVYDNNKEWMDGKSAWTAHTIKFILTEEATVTISLGYGTGSNNIGANNTPAIYVSHLQLTTFDPLADAKAILKSEIETAEALKATEGYNAGIEELTNAIAIANNALTTANTIEELTNATETLKAAEQAFIKTNLIAANAALVEGAALDNPVVAPFIVNGTFDQNVNGWTCTGGFQNKALASNQQGDFTVPFFENWNPDAKENKMYQTVQNIPNGVYKLKIAAFVNILADPNESQFVFANNDKVFLTTGDPTFYEVYTKVEDNTLEVGLEQTTATANWMGIDNVSLIYFGNECTVDEAIVAAPRNDYLVVLAEANGALADEAYNNVTGEERTALSTAIETIPEATKEGYEAATATLTNTIAAFKNAKASYDALADANAQTNIILPYALASKKPEAKVATTAAAAETAANEVYSALRPYYESNAKAENVEGAEDKTALITNPDATDGNNGWTIEGNMNNPRNTESWTDSEGNNSYMYFDGGNWGGNSWTTTMKQTVTLPIGKYLLTAKGRASENVTTTLSVGEVSTEMAHVGSTGNIFARGWADSFIEFETPNATENEQVEIVVTASANAVHEWFSVGDFRLTKLKSIVTGIETVKAETAQKAIYNLNGQKVMKAQKGLYIINGKKVVVK